MFIEKVVYMDVRPRWGRIAAARLFCYKHLNPSGSLIFYPFKQIFIFKFNFKFL
jgi:hypothetical protein